MGVWVDFQRPACMTHARSILRANKSCVAPTQLEAPPDLVYHYQAYLGGHFQCSASEILPSFAPKLGQTFLSEAQMICRE